MKALARAHYVPAFARLGPYPTSALDSLAYSRRKLFEYLGHASGLMPISRSFDHLAARTLPPEIAAALDLNAPELVKTF
jgi:uncharacterized protein YcaQ